jgi:hypothetical protein
MVTEQKEKETHVMIIKIGKEMYNIHHFCVSMYTKNTDICSY